MKNKCNIELGVAASIGLLILLMCNTWIRVLLSSVGIYGNTTTTMFRRLETTVNRYQSFVIRSFLYYKHGSN
jgi:hypothetical protein